MNLTSMLVKPLMILEYLPTRFAESVLAVVMAHQIHRVLELHIASLAVMMPWTLNPVFFQTMERREILVADMAHVMAIRITYVLAESGVVWEVAVAACTVRHRSRRRES
jgi:hypothetical protein